MLNTLHAPVGNMWIFIRVRIRILHVVQSAGPLICIIPVAILLLSKNLFCLALFTGHTLKSTRKRQVFRKRGRLPYRTATRSTFLCFCSIQKRYLNQYQCLLVCENQKQGLTLTFTAYNALMLSNFM